MALLLRRNTSDGRSGGGFGQKPGLRPYLRALSFSGGRQPLRNFLTLCLPRWVALGLALERAMFFFPPASHRQLKNRLSGGKAYNHSGNYK
jgi:hypothetical protein